MGVNTRLLAHRVTDTAKEQLLASLASYGNVLSADLEFGLTALLTRMTEMATDRFTGRRGWGLPCGGGKTQAAVAWVLCKGERVCDPRGVVSEVTRIGRRRPVSEQKMPQVTPSHERLGVTDQDREVRLDK